MVSLLKDMKTFITSDTHFGHANILKFCPNTRQYQDADHMNEALITQWNSVVGADDLVYHLGDFAFLSAEKAREIVSRLNGRIVLIEGNHDRKLLKDPGFRMRLSSVHDYLEIIVNGVLVCLFHYPISAWNQCHRGSVHFFGHQHGNMPKLNNRSMDVGIDATGAVVSNLDDLVQKLVTEYPISKHH